MLTVAEWCHLLSGRTVAGVPVYVGLTKGLAIGLHVVVLLALAVAIHRVVAVVRGEASFAVTIACWVAAGLLLAANPSYVVWMGSGLENPLLTATVAVIAAVCVRAVPL